MRSARTVAPTNVEPDDPSAKKERSSCLGTGLGEGAAVAVGFGAAVVVGTAVAVGFGAAAVVVGATVVVFGAAVVVVGAGVVFGVGAGACVQAPISIVIVINIPAISSKDLLFLFPISSS